MNTREQSLQAFLESLGFRGFEADWPGVEQRIRFHDPSMIPPEVHAKAVHASEECITRDVWSLRDAEVITGERTKGSYRGNASGDALWRTMVRVTGSRPIIVVKHFHNRFPMPGHYHVRSVEVVGDSQTINFTVEAPQSGMICHWDIFAPLHELEKALGEGVQFETEPLMPYLEE